MVHGYFFEMKVREFHLESGHEKFVDNLKEGVIIHPKESDHIKLFNKVARKML